MRLTYGVGRYTETSERLSPSCSQRGGTFAELAEEPLGPCLPTTAHHDLLTMLFFDLLRPLPKSQILPPWSISFQAHDYAATLVPVTLPRCTSGLQQAHARGCIANRAANHAEP